MRTSGASSSNGSVERCPEPLRECLGVVVSASNEVALADIAAILGPGSVRYQVVIETAFRAHPACEYSAFDLCIWHLEVDHTVDVEALQKELRLPFIAREAVDDESVVPVVFVETPLDDGLDQIIADEVAALDDAFHLSTELGAFATQRAIGLQRVGRLAVSSITDPADTRREAKDDLPATEAVVLIRSGPARRGDMGVVLAALGGRRGLQQIPQLRAQSGLSRLMLPFVLTA